MSNTPNTLATEWGTDARTVRKFLRSDASGIESVGKGARYALPTAKREVSALAKRFTAWNEARKAPIADEVTESPNEG